MHVHTYTYMHACMLSIDRSIDRWGWMDARGWWVAMQHGAVEKNVADSPVRPCCLCTMADGLLHPMAPLPNVRSYSWPAVVRPFLEATKRSPKPCGRSPHQ